MDFTIIACVAIVAVFVILMSIPITMYIRYTRDREINGDPYWDAKEGICTGLLKKTKKTKKTRKTK